MKRLTGTFILLGAFFLSCNGEMIEKGLISAQDPRVPEINVKQGATDIPDGATYSLDLANGVKVNETSESILFTIENTGTADLVLGDITAGGENADDFAVSDQPASLILLPGTNSTFSVTFSPQSADPKSAEIVIPTNDFDEAEYSFTITGQSLPFADFSARIRYGYAPLTVTFENRTDGDVDSYLWNFGDGTTSTESSPSHTYTDTGTYTVELQVTGPGGFGYRYVDNYVKVYRSQEHVVDNYFLYSYALIPVDINDDAHIDIIATSNTDEYEEIAWWKNDGTGNFSKYIVENSWVGAMAITAAKINNDDFMDIIATASGGEHLAWWENNGDGTSWTKTVLDTTITSPESVIISNIDNTDGLDIIVAGAGTNEIVWFKNDGSGTGTFSSKNIIASSFTSANSVYAADIDDDGDIDIVASARGLDTITWFENDDITIPGSGNGTSWIPHEIDTAISWPYSVTVADIDKDNDLDIIAGASDGSDINSIHEITWFENDGSPTDDPSTDNWTSHVLVTNFPGSESDMNVYDIDGDGDIDIYACSNTDGTIAWWENPVTGINTSWTEHYIASSFYSSQSIQAADFNSDGAIDFAAAANNPSNKIYWWDMNLAGWEKQIVNDNFTNASSVYSSDLDDDGDYDLIAASPDKNEIAWWENDGLGKIVYKHTISDNFMDAQAIYSCDIDNDNDMDIVSAGGDNSDGEFALWINNGDLTFTKVSLATNLKGGNTVYAADIDGDNDLDIIGAAFFEHNLYWWRNNGNGNFGTTNIINTTSFSNPSSIFAVDIDGDENIDIICAAYIGNEVAWWENDGSEMLSQDDWTKHTVGGFTGPTSIYSIDIDGNGHNDIIVSRDGQGTAGEISLWLNNGNSENMFVGMDNPNSIDSDIAPATGVTSADINGDGIQDIIASAKGMTFPTSQNGIISWYKGDGTGSFGQRQTISLFNGASSVHTVDIDNDGDIDICGTSSSENEIAIWSNNLRDYGP